MERRDFLGHADLAAELGVGAVVHVDLVFVELRPGHRRPVADQLDPIRDFEDEGVRTGARAEGCEKHQVPGLGDVEHRGEAHWGGPGVGVAEPRRQPAGLELSLGEAELLADPHRELAVGLVEDRVGEILGLEPHLLHHAVGGVHAGSEVGRLAGESAAVPRVVHVLPPPEVRGVGGPRVRVHHVGQDAFVVVAEDEGGGTCGR
jgi:hypothetical protein